MAGHVVDARGTGSDSGAPGSLTPPRPLPNVEGYEVRQQLAQTQASDIYLAVHAATGALRTLAIQRIESEPAAVRRMVSEVLEAGRVKHPGVALVDGAGTTGDNRLYVATAYIEGVTLGQLLSSEGHLPARRALLIALRAAEALEAAHRLGVTHGELTPEQIIIGPAGPDGADRVTVTGFGMSAERTLVPLKADRPYASPERLSAGTLDARSDVFSLASVLLHVLSGNAPPPPRVGKGTTPASSPAVRPGARPAPAQVLLTARATEPERRYQTIAAFRDALMLAFGADDATRKTPENPLGIMRATPVPSRAAPVVQPGIVPVTAGPIVGAPLADAEPAVAPLVTEPIAPAGPAPAVPAPVPAPAAVAAPTPAAPAPTVPPAPPAAPPAAAVSPASITPMAPPAPVAEPVIQPIVTTPMVPVTPPATLTVLAAPEPAPAPTELPFVSPADVLLPPAASAPPPAPPTQPSIVVESVFESLGRPSYSEPLFTAPPEEPAAASPANWAERGLGVESWAPVGSPAVPPSSTPSAELKFLTPARTTPIGSRPAKDRRVWMIGGALAATVVVGVLLLRPQAAPVPPAPPGVSHVEGAVPPPSSVGAAATPVTAGATSAGVSAERAKVGDDARTTAAVPDEVAKRQAAVLPKVDLPNVPIRPTVGPSDARLAQGAISEVEGSTKPSDVALATRPAEVPAVEAKTRAEINAAVARFARALESRDIDALKKAYPGLTNAERESWTAFFRSSESVRATFIAQDFKYVNGGVEADAVGKLTFYKRDIRQSLENAVRFHVLFRHGPNGWVMRSIQ